MALPITPVSPPLCGVGSGSGRGPATKAPIQSAPLSFVGPKNASDSPDGEVSIDRVRAAAEKINAHLRNIPTALEFRVDNDTQKIVVKMVNSDTGEVIRQFPSDELLAIAKALKDAQVGLLVHKKA